jgi:lysylphosphatidylglycerol synthetase-like protein (DUF2156 family)
VRRLPRAHERLSRAYERLVRAYERLDRVLNRLPAAARGAFALCFVALVALAGLRSRFSASEGGLLAALAVALLLSDLAWRRSEARGRPEESA